MVMISRDAPHSGPAAAAPSAAVHVGTAADGTLTYLVNLPPEALPPVRLRDLAAAWDDAREAAIAARFDAARLFRFRREDGSCTDLALADHDARCWAGAVDRTVGMGSSYGLSLCLRLLALVDLLARAGWARGLFALKRDGADIDPAVLRTAATCALTHDARFDESGFRAQVGTPRIGASGPRNLDLGNPDLGNPDLGKSGLGNSGPERTDAGFTPLSGASA